MDPAANSQSQGQGQTNPNPPTPPTPPTPPVPPAAAPVPPQAAPTPVPPVAPAPGVQPMPPQPGMPPQYPPQPMGGYPPQPGMYPPQGAGYPPYPPMGGYPPQPGMPPQYPPQGGPMPGGGGFDPAFGPMGGGPMPGGANPYGANPYGANPYGGAPVPEDTTPANFQLGTKLPPVLKVKVPPHSLNFDGEYFIRLLAGSISLSKDEKKKIVESVPKLKQSQIDELIRIFEEEKQKFAALSKKHVPQLEKLAVQHYDEWMELESETELSAKKQQDEGQAEAIRKQLGI